MVSPALEVIQPGLQSTIQDWPGRIGFWRVGIPPSGPMDELSFRLANRLLGNAARRARFAGAETRSVALAAVRAPREGTLEEAGEALPCIIGTPLAGEVIDGISYDGKTEIALFPGDLPENPESALEPDAESAINFLRFAPPGGLPRTADGAPVLPNIRLDRALDFLLGDKLR